MRFTTTSLHEKSNQFIVQTALKSRKRKASLKTIYLSVNTIVDVRGAPGRKKG